MITDKKRIAFENIKDVLHNPRIRVLNKQGCPFMIETYARQYALGDVLSGAGGGIHEKSLVYKEKE